MDNKKIKGKSLNTMISADYVEGSHHETHHVGNMDHALARFYLNINTSM